MPTTNLSNKYKGLSFGEIAKSIEKKYQDRLDPISTRGKMSEMTTLRDEQEYVKQKMQIQENLKQVLAQAQQPQIPQQVDPTQMSNPMLASNEGVAPQMLPQQDMGHSASQSYNEQFGYGGTMDYSDGGPMWSPGAMFGDNQRFVNEFNPVPTAVRNKPSLDFSKLEKILPDMNTRTYGTQKQVPVTPEVNEQINPLRYAPLLANLYNIAATRKPKSTASTLADMGVRTQVDESLANQVQPRQTQFNNIDFSNLERGITNQARGFTGTNMNVAGGNAGQFLANEVANQGNVMQAIAQARLAQQQGNQQVSQLNAQEQARVDQFQLAQSGQRQQVQAQNIGIGMHMADLDARNQGAATSNRLANIAGLATNLGNIGREEDQMKMIANALGYSSFGTFMESMSEEEKKQAMPGIMQLVSNIFKSRG